VIRTAWLTFACLVVLGVLAAGKAPTTPVGPVSAHGAVDGATVGAGFNQDTLAKGDRLEITYVRQEAPVQSALQPTDPLILPVPTIVPPVETKIISRHWHDSNAAGSSAAQSRQPRKWWSPRKADPPIPKAVRTRIIPS
jgi:hypothetical protein